MSSNKDAYTNLGFNDGGQPTLVVTPTSYDNDAYKCLE
jgi:hypothetical protein